MVVYILSFSSTEVNDRPESRARPFKGQTHYLPKQKSSELSLSWDATLEFDWRESGAEPARYRWEQLEGVWGFVGYIVGMSGHWRESGLEFVGHIVGTTGGSLELTLSGIWGRQLEGSGAESVGYLRRRRRRRRRRRIIFTF